MAGARPWFRRMVARVAVMVVLVAGLSDLAVPVLAQAATALGSLSLDPPTGLDSTAITLATVSSGTSKGCPQSGPNADVVITGPAGWSAGIVAARSAGTGISTATDFSLPLADTFGGLATRNGLTIPAGKYELVLQCWSDSGAVSYGEFTTAIWFIDGTHYQSSDPTTSTPSPTASDPSPSPSLTPPVATPVPSPTSTSRSRLLAGPDLLGSLTVTPASGFSSTGLFVRTVSTGPNLGCPAPSVSASLWVSGPGQWASGVRATGLSGISNSSELEFVPVFDTVAGENQLTIEPGKYTLTAYCQDELGTVSYGEFTGAIWFTSATEYQSTDPATTQSPTHTVIGASPEDRVDLGSLVTLTATVTPASATGTVQFRNYQGGSYSKVGKAVKVVNGQATMSSSSLGFSLYEFSALFTPADKSKLTSSASPDMVYVVALPVPPIPVAETTIYGILSLGQTVSCVAHFSNAKSYAYSWFRDRQTEVGQTQSYVLVSADVGHKIRCQALATNTGGTVSRASAAAKVAE